ncbi:hypothetical protein TSUD_47010 [Trifolium subterraneum]|nr:hypothetical protein TSUD_47010 [Trifolium subterraneum]
MPNNATTPVQPESSKPENAPVTALVIPEISTLSKKLSLKLVPMPIRGKDNFLVEDIESCAKVSALRKYLECYSSSALPEDRGYFFIHKQSVMYEDESFEQHGVNDGHTIEI